MLWSWGWLFALRRGHAGFASLPALCGRPHLYLEHVHKNEKTGSKDHDDYDESENLCW